MQSQDTPEQRPAPRPAPSHQGPCPEMHALNPRGPRGNTREHQALPPQRRHEATQPPPSTKNMTAQESDWGNKGGELNLIFKSDHTATAAHGHPRLLRRRHVDPRAHGGRRFSCKTWRRSRRHRRQRSRGRGGLRRSSCRRGRLCSRGHGELWRLGCRRRRQSSRGSGEISGDPRRLLRGCFGRRRHGRPKC